MNNKKAGVFLALLLAGGMMMSETAFAQIESDFIAALTTDLKGAEIVRYTGSATRVWLPATIEGFPVRGIGMAAFAVYNYDLYDVFYDNSIRPGPNPILITSVVIPEKVTYIGVDAFYNQSLTSVTLPSTIIEIGDYCFANCSALTTVTIPNIVKELKFGVNSFIGCSSLNLESQAALRKLGYTGIFKW